MEQQTSEKRSINSVLVAFAIVSVVGGLYLWVRGKGNETAQLGLVQEAAKQVASSVASQTPATPQVAITLVKEGSGDLVAENGDEVSIQYAGSFTDGKVFDSSTQRGPFAFTLGAKQVIPGMEQGVFGMKIEEERKLAIPPELAYGEAGVQGAIPPNATLIFDVTMVSVKKATPKPE